MNREIKFEYGFQSQNGIVKKVYNLAQIPRIAQICDVWNELPICYIREYIGLKDRNRKEIYDRDILDCGEYHGIKEVVFMNGSYKIRGKMGQMVGFGSWANKTKVIGNIHENPELL